MGGACTTGPGLGVGVAAAAAVDEMNPTLQQQLGSVHIQQTTWDAPGSFEGFAGGSDPADLTLPCWLESFLSVHVMEWDCEACAAVCSWASQEQMPVCFCSLGPDVATWFYKPSLWLALQVVLAPPPIKWQLYLPDWYVPGFMVKAKWENLCHCRDWCG